MLELPIELELRKLGLTEKEVRVYLAGLELGPSSVQNIAKRAEIIHDSLTKMENITCNYVEGAMYAFPKINFSEKILNEAKKQKLVPDVMYSL